MRVLQFRKNPARGDVWTDEGLGVFAHDADARADQRVGLRRVRRETSVPVLESWMYGALEDFAPEAPRASNSPPAEQSGPPASTVQRASGPEPPIRALRLDIALPERKVSIRRVVSASLWLAAAVAVIARVLWVEPLPVARVPATMPVTAVPATPRERATKPASKSKSRVLLHPRQQITQPPHLLAVLRPVAGPLGFGGAPIGFGRLVG
jgi:hypothetical protein